ncbi:hypothetical protein [Zymobacter palmae]|nr:hypothetical protein [Zymobacter palmae]BBG31265.1 flagellar biosynthesis pathway, component FlhA [Zymobacter palmae]
MYEYDDERLVSSGSRPDILMWLLVALPLVSMLLPDALNMVVGMVGLGLCIGDSRTLTSQGYKAPHAALGLISPVYVLVRAIKLNDALAWAIFAAYIASIILSFVVLFIQYPLP